jgi:hypothetical protein
MPRCIHISGATKSLKRFAQYISIKFSSLTSVNDYSISFLQSVRPPRPSPHDHFTLPEWRFPQASQSVGDGKHLCSSLVLAAPCEIEETSRLEL